MKSLPVRSIVLTLLTVLPGLGCREHVTQVPAVPEAAVDASVASPASGLRSLVFAGGCFWCTEAVFEELRGVEAVVSGYAGGKAENATYRLVSAGATNHAEVIRVDYDPALISRGKLFEVFFAVAHNPTQLDYQGPDHGRQYRSAIFFADEEEKRAAEAYIEALAASRAYADPIVTTLEPLEAFYPAEDYHQDYVRLNPTQSYVVYNALPKVAKLKKAFPGLLK